MLDRARVVLTVVLALAMASVAIAQEPPPDIEYTSVVRNALAEFGAGRYAEARALFLRAHELEPSARTLRGIGMASFELRAYVDAVRALSGAVSDARRPLDDAQRAAATALLGRARGFIGAYHLDVEPPDAQIVVDGRTLVLEPDGALLLDTGRHELVARAPGRSDTTVPVDVRGGEDARLDVHLPRAPAAGPELLATPHGGAASHAAVRGTDAAPAVWLSVGGALAAASIIVGIVWWADLGTQLGICHDPPAGMMCTNGSDLESQQLAAGAVTLTLAGLAATALTIGIVTLLSGNGARARPSATLACAPGPLAVACAGAF